jgi:glycogen(starch) synthase
MRVLILTADWPPQLWSGVGTAVRAQAEALAARGVEVTVLVAARPGAAPVDGGEQAGVEVRALSGARFPVDPRRFDVVHLHALPLAELAVELCRRFSLPLVMTVHMLVHRERAAGAATAFFSGVQRRLLAACWRAVFVSQAEHEAATRAWPELGLESPERAAVIPNGLPPARPRARDDGACDNLDGPLVFAGRFAESKGLGVLAEAAPRILARRPGRLVLAGGHGDGAGARAVARLEEALGDRCQVTGWLAAPALEALLARAALVLVPSLYEPFGLVALEAMRLGAPVLAAAVGGLREVVGPGSGGRLVDGHDPERWARAALALLDDRDERARLGRRGPAHVAARFDAATTARRLVEEAYAA